MSLPVTPGPVSTMVPPAGMGVPDVVVGSAFGVIGDTLNGVWHWLWTENPVLLGLLGLLWGWWLIGLVLDMLAAKRQPEQLELF